MEKGAAPMSYAGALTGRLAHAPCIPTSSEDKLAAERLKKQERVEPELVAAASHFGKYAEFHPTKARLGEELPANLYRSNAGFLINKQAVAVKLDKNKVLKEMDFFSRFGVIAYFVGGSLPFNSLQD